MNKGLRLSNLIFILFITLLTLTACKSDGTYPNSTLTNANRQISETLYVTNTLNPSGILSPTIASEATPEPTVTTNPIGPAQSLFTNSEIHVGGFVIPEGDNSYYIRDKNTVMFFNKKENTDTVFFECNNYYAYIYEMFLIGENLYYAMGEDGDDDNGTYELHRVSKKDRKDEIVITDYKTAVYVSVSNILYQDNGGKFLNYIIDANQKELILDTGSQFINAVFLDQAKGELWYSGYNDDIQSLYRYNVTSKKINKVMDFSENQFYTIRNGSIILYRNLDNYIVIKELDHIGAAGTRLKCQTIDENNYIMSIYMNDKSLFMLCEDQNNSETIYQYDLLTKKLIKKLDIGKTANGICCTSVFSGLWIINYDSVVDAESGLIRPTFYIFNGSTGKKLEYPETEAGYGDGGKGFVICNGYIWLYYSDNSEMGGYNYHGRMDAEEYLK